MPQFHVVDPAMKYEVGVIFSPQEKARYDELFGQYSLAAGAAAGTPENDRRVELYHQLVSLVGEGNKRFRDPASISRYDA